MRFDVWISQRLQVRKGARAGASTGAIIAVAGVALALIVMELSIAISVGFKDEIRRKVMGFDAPVSVLPAYNYDLSTSEELITITDTLKNIIRRTAPNASLVTTMKRQAVLKTDSNFAAVQCVGRDINHNFNFEHGNMVSGRFPDYSVENSADSVVVSTPLANKLSLSIGDKTYLYFFVDDEVKMRRVYVSGLYKSDFGEYDNSIIYTSLGLLQKLGNNKNTATSLDLENVQIEDIEQLSNGLQNSLIEQYQHGKISRLYPVTNILNTGAIFFNWLELLDTNVVIIFILMLCVSMFTLISSLFIIILDRIPTIGLLRSLGASGNCISRIFVNISMKLVGKGLLIGNIIGIGLIILQDKTHLMPLNPDMYYLSYVPVDFNLLSILLLNIGFAVCTWFILILPAKVAAKIDPAKTMRYE